MIMRAVLQRLPAFEATMLRVLMLHLQRCVELPGNRCTCMRLDGWFRPLIVRDVAVPRDGDVHSLVASAVRVGPRPSVAWAWGVRPLRQEVGQPRR